MIGGDGTDGSISPGRGGDWRSSYWSSYVFSGDGETLKGKDGLSFLAEDLEEELAPWFDVSVPSKSSCLVLTLKEDLNETFVLDPLSWGADFMTIELDMNGHSIHGSDGTPEHPDGYPGILRLDTESEWGSEHGSSFLIYDSTFSRIR